MMQLNVLKRLLQTPMGIFNFGTSLVVALCVATLFIAIIFNFAESNPRAATAEKRSIVDTGTMVGFFVLYYICARLRIGPLPPPAPAWHIVLSSIATIVLVFGPVVNIWGRLTLGHNWANQIKMYQNQTLVRFGPYRFVRHPLYASLVWMFLAGSVLYWNIFLFLLTVCIFLPFMVWRARQEEVLLEATFPEYRHYRRNIGMFFPKIVRLSP